MQVRLFLGCLQNKEILIHLKQSPQWKDDKLLGQSSLEETQKGDLSYIGLFLPCPSPYGEIQKKEEEIKTKLQLYCPKLNLDKHHFYLFSQVFIH